MINIIQPSQRANMTLNVDSGEINGAMEVPDSLHGLADQVGIVGAINDINHESIQHDQDLREMHNINSNEDSYSPGEYQEQSPQLEYEQESESYSEPKKKTKKKNKTADQRIRELTYQSLQTQHEKEELERELRQSRDEHAAALLSFEKQRLAHDLSRVSDIMVQAQEEGEHKTYVDANKIYNKLSMQESETDAALSNLQNEYKQYQKVDDPYEKYAEEKFISLSDPRELNSDAYADWLTRNGFYNSYNAKEFDPDLANDHYQVKRNFNKYLKSTGNADYISTPEYYDELDVISRQSLFGNYAPPMPSQSYSNQGYQQQEDPNMAFHSVHIDPEYDRSLGHATPEGQERMHYPDPETYQQPPQPPQRSNPQQRGYAPQQQSYNPQQPQQRQAPPQQQRSQNVMPVNRAGYSPNYQSNDLPQLDPLEHKLALSFPMYDDQSRPLSDAERLHQYRLGKAGLRRT